MNAESSSESLVKDTLRATALMLVPVVAFLAILSAVALFAVPTPQAKEGDSAEQHAAPQDTNAPAHATPNTRAAIKPNKI
jgi:hypothetical protein